MILHIGSDEYVPLSSVIAVLDADRRKDFEPLLNEKNVQRIGTERIKSIIVTQTDGRCVFFLSPISAQTLRKRVESGAA